MEKRAQKPEWVKRLALERINRLFQLARDNVKTHPERSRRYVGLATTIAKRYTVRLDSKTKRSFCKNCNTPLVPGLTEVVRTSKGRVWHICTFCGVRKGYPYGNRG